MGEVFMRLKSQWESSGSSGATLCQADAPPLELQ